MFQEKSIFKNGQSLDIQHHGYKCFFKDILTVLNDNTEQVIKFPKWKWKLLSHVRLFATPWT